MEKSNINHITTVTKLSEIYEDISNSIEEIHKPRFSNLKLIFSQKYKKECEFISRAPARVNLIGEHIDYMGYGVFPFALVQDTLIAFSNNSSSILRINHVQSEEFPTVEVDLSKEIVTNNLPNYSKYILAGFRSNKVFFEGNLKGADLLVCGNVPLASGLSSSSSLTVCSAVCGLTIHELNQKVEINSFIENIIKFERELGTACGGMDQTISVLGQKQRAFYIQFNPLTAEPILLPDNICFVIGNSKTPSAKLAHLGTRYNKRVSECRFALRLICKKLNISILDNNIHNLSDLQKYLKYSFEEMIEVVKKNIENKSFTREELEKILEINLETIILDIVKYDKVLSENTHFYPYERAIHVYSEAQRVILFKQLNQNEEIENEKKIKELGRLMNESQKSCKELYDCSSTELDKFIEFALKNGALGSRLTGAGWGGCTVSMILIKNAQNFVNLMKKDFYLGDKSENNDIFISSPSSGAVVFKI